MAITDFSIHSIGLILFELKKGELFTSFIDDMIINGIKVLSLNDEELKRLEKIGKLFNMDFDDAYQYVASEKYNLVIVSFDRDFDNTPLGRKEPGEIAK